MKAKFTTPKLSKTSKYWYVHYRYEGKQFRDKWFKQNRKRKGRELCYKELCSRADLKKGWNQTCLTKFSSRICISLKLKVCFRKEKKTIYHIKPMAVIMEL
jgi:hypothetical protein